MATYGFLGLGIMGSAMAANLVRAGFDVVVWNRTRKRAAPLVEMGARRGSTPRDVAAESDITFAMLSDPSAVCSVCEGPDGALAGVGAGHDFANMSTVDDEASIALANTVHANGGRFLEAPVSGTKQPAIDGALVILAAGDRSLFDDARPAFEAMSKSALFLGETGQGARMKLVVNAMMGGMLAAFCEGVALGQRAGLDTAQLLEVVDAGAMANPMFRAKGPMLLRREYAPSFPLKHMQKDLRLAEALSERLVQPIPCISASNEVYKRALDSGHGDEDLSAVFEAIR